MAHLFPDLLTRLAVHINHNNFCYIHGHIHTEASKSKGKMEENEHEGFRSISRGEPVHTGDSVHVVSLLHDIYNAAWNCANIHPAWF